MNTTYLGLQPTFITAHFLSFNLLRCALEHSYFFAVSSEVSLIRLVGISSFSCSRCDLGGNQCLLQCDFSRCEELLFCLLVPLTSPRLAAARYSVFRREVGGPRDLNDDHVIQIGCCSPCRKRLEVDHQLHCLQVDGNGKFIFTASRNRDESADRSAREPTQHRSASPRTKRPRWPSWANDHPTPLVVISTTTSSGEVSTRPSTHDLALDEPACH
jgi:hypothetical protein